MNGDYLLYRVYGSPYALGRIYQTNNNEYILRSSNDSLVRLMYKHISHKVLPYKEFNHIVDSMCLMWNHDICSTMFEEKEIDALFDDAPLSLYDLIVMLK